MVVHSGSTFLAMNTPAISASAATGAAVAPRLVPAPGPRRHARGDPRDASRAIAHSPRVARAGGEILAGVLLLVAWTLLWVFFLDAVVSPAAALHGAGSPAAARRAAASPSLLVAEPPR